MIMFGLLDPRIILGALAGSLAGWYVAHTLGPRRFGFLTPMTAAEKMGNLSKRNLKTNGLDALAERRKIIDICMILQESFRLEHENGDPDACREYVQRAYELDFAITSLLCSLMATHQIPNPLATDRCKCGLQSWEMFVRDQQDGLKIAESRIFN